MRKIAKRLKISKDTVLKYIKSTPHVEEISPAPTTGTTVTTESKDKDWPTPYRDKPPRELTVGGMSPSEYLDNYGPIQDYFLNRDDRLPRRRGISFNQLYRESDYYSKDLNYNNQYGTAWKQGIPVPPIIHRASEAKPMLEGSIKGIIQEYNNQKKRQELQLLSEKIDRLIKLEREDHKRKEKVKEIREQKLAVNQNEKIEIENQNNILTTNQDNTSKNILQVEELQKTENEQNEQYQVNKNDTSSFSPMNIFLYFAKGFEGISPTIGGLIGLKPNEKNYHQKYPKKEKAIFPTKVKVLEFKKEENNISSAENKIVLTPADKIVLTPVDNVVKRKPVKAIK